MTLIFTAATIATVTNVQNMLECNGIACELRNQFVGAGMGELPPIECWPEVWVDDSDVERARQLLAEGDAPAEADGEPWQCRHCGEQVDAVFAQCWNCNTERPLSSTTN